MSGPILLEPIYTQYALGYNILQAPTNVSDEVIFLQHTFRGFGLVCGIFTLLAMLFFFTQFIMIAFVGFECFLKKSTKAACIPTPTKPPIALVATTAVRHLAVIMDGNRRYGRRKYGHTTKGHWDGGHTLVAFMDWCIEAGIQMLTVYAFSTENWKRDPSEVNALMSIFENFSIKLKKTAVEKGICVRFLTSDPLPLPPRITAVMRAVEQVSARCDKLQLNVCLSYGSRGEIAEACKSIAKDVVAGKLAIKDIDENCFGQSLLTAGLPDPDLVLRTSGESRLSNFLLWQLAYVEIVILEKNWPEMTREDLWEVLQTFAQRQRRFGK
eukprot:NODE_2819_length_1084_cov_18.013584_g2689_i0.p1 GENE.NODE_2819_length_1084_cov_18.013584_g2689_i0~~NODE_2819_length_1084_cov_18.013584_g2689_i0.p1  ORF type:complete len:345 (-),score=103.89 NODE_2819_length_1084_cov_18.013584_g2689_i0:50-1027(-)